MNKRRARFNVLNALLLTAVAAARADSGELVTMSGTEPLKSQINQSKSSVRLLFLGSPT